MHLIELRDICKTYHMGELDVPVLRGISLTVEQGEMVAARTAFRDFYVARSVERIRQRVDYYAPKVGAGATSVDVRELGNRWASCSPTGALAFHWKCMMAPQTIIDYIVVHELCHFHHRDHTDAFWNEVDKVMPDYRERKDWLRKRRRPPLARCTKTSRRKR